MTPIKIITAAIHTNIECFLIIRYITYSLIHWLSKKTERPLPLHGALGQASLLAPNTAELFHVVQPVRTEPPVGRKVLLDEKNHLWLIGAQTYLSLYHMPLPVHRARQDK